MKEAFEDHERIISELKENWCLEEEDNDAKTEDEPTQNLAEWDFLIISLCEFFALLAGVISLSQVYDLKGHTLIYITDNDNVKSWVSKRSSNNPFARFLLLMLSALELSLGFRIVSAYLRTYHNVTADDLTRDDPKEVAKAKGLEKLPTVDWSHFFSRGWTKRSILWEGQLDQDTDTALQLAYRRSPPGPRDFVFVIWDCTPPSAALARAAITASLKGKVVVPLGNTLNPTGADPIFHGEVLPPLH